MCMLAVIHTLSLLSSVLLSTVPPSPDLVERVRDLYHKRVPDVRFLIPVINGLEKVSPFHFYVCIQFPAGRHPVLLDALFVTVVL